MINGIEISRDSLSDWTCETLHSIQGTLAHNIGQGWGDVSEEKLLMKLISNEIKRQVKVQNINTAILLVLTFVYAVHLKREGVQ